MQIKNVEALKTWLTGRLEKICDADPAALAKYVVALVRKDKLLGELEEICIDQLEVFLANDTVSFVNTLFEVLQNNSYIPAPPTPTTPLPEPPKPSNPPEPPKPSNPPAPPKPSNPPAPPKPAAKRLLSTEESLRPQAAESSVLDEDDRDFRRTRKPTEDVEERASSTANRDAYMGYKIKKRRAEPDHDAGLRSKISRDDASDAISTDSKGKQQTDVLRKKEGGDEHHDERADKQRESSSDRENSQRRFEGSARGRHNDNKIGKNRMYKGRPWPNKRARCRDYDEKGFCMRGEFCPFDHGNDPLVVEDVNMPGIVLGFPHGAHPPGFMPERPPLNPAGRMQGLRPPMPPMQFPIRPPAPPNANVHVPTNPPPDIDGARHGAPRLPGTSQSKDERPPHGQPPNSNVRPRLPIPHYKEVAPNGNDVYNPEQPSFDRGMEKPPVWTRLGTQLPQHVNPMQRNRELLQVSTSERPTTTSSGPPETVGTAAVTASSVRNVASNVVTEEPTLVKNIATPSVSQGRKYTNTVLEIKKLPPDKNNISTLNDYFQKFGKIINIQVSAFGQADMALIQFSTNTEANKAITCADAVLGNRFIRVFWYKPDSEQNNQSRNVADNQPVKQTVEKPVAVAPTMFQTGKTSFKVTSTSSVPVSKKDGPPPQVQEIMKKKLLFQKQKQELLGKQIAQQKLLINKLEQNKNLSINDKDEIMQTLKSVSESITKLKSEAKVTVALAKSKESPAQARLVAKKELLDRELDLITHEQTGEDTTELRQRVEELKKEAHSLGLLDSSRHGRARVFPRGSSRGLGRGHGRGRGHVSRSAAVLDKRPKQLLVEGYSGEERDLITRRFKEFGDINRIEQDKEANRLILTFTTRKQAEIAIQQISTFNIKNLKVSWHRPLSSLLHATLKIPVNESLEHSATVSTMNEQEVEDLLLGGDLDEEEEEEERSWRR